MTQARNHNIARTLDVAGGAEGSLEQRAYVAIRDILIQGGFPPGERLSIRKLAARLGVSAMPVRAALSRLAAVRCVDILASGSAIVPMISRREYIEITRLRQLLESIAAADAVPKLTRADRAALQAIAADAKAARAAGDEETYRLKDRQLHQHFYAAADQPTLMSLIETLWMRRSAVIALARPLMPTRPDSDDHASLLAAACAMDAAAAAEAARSEIERSASFVMARLRFPDDSIEHADGWTALRSLTSDGAG